MEIATILNAHGNTELVLDTIDAIKTYVSDDILMVVDGAQWESWGAQVKVPAYKLEGLYHNYKKAPYRNLTYGLMNALKLFPNRDWYCYCEYDVLFTSDQFKQELQNASKNNIWMIGNDLRIYNYNFSYLEKLLNIQLKETKYLLGCCTFMSGKFLRKLEEINFFNRFLEGTNSFSDGFFPGFEEQGGYDFGEHLYPTLATYFGGGVAQFAYWHQFFNQWGGFFKKYPMRWKPELGWEDIFKETSIMHPVKEFTEIRKFHHWKRKRMKNVLQS